MPTSVALSPHFVTFIRDQVESGRYNNVTRARVHLEWVMSKATEALLQEALRA